MSRRQSAVRGALAGVLSLGVAGAFVLPGNGQALPQVTRQFTAVADTFLDSARPGEPNGDLKSIRVDGVPALRSLLRFDVAGTRGGVTRAALRLWALSKGSGATTMHDTGSSWSEATTWSGQPKAGDEVGTVPAHGADMWVQVDVSDAVRDNGAVDLLLSSSGRTAERFASRESGEHAPRLLVTAGVAPGTEVVTPPPPTVVPVTSLGDGIVRAAFYYPWFREAWRQQGAYPFTNYHPTAGLYDSGDPETVDRTFRDLRYAGMSAVLSSWQGPGSPTDRRLPLLLSRAPRFGLSVAAYYEKEGSSDPSVAVLRSDLQSLSKTSASPAYLRVGGKPVVFVYGDPKDGCPMAHRWAAAGRDLGLYVVLKIFPGYATCSARPDAWHQYSPAERSVTVGHDAVSVSPGFWKKGDPAPRLARDVAAFDRAITAMAASRAHFQLLTTYNEWGEGTGVESAREWVLSGHDNPYLNVLHRRLASDPVIAAAGDIACTPDDPNYKQGVGTPSNCRQQATADLLARINPDVVLPLGDVQYECGDLTSFQTDFGASWGKFKTRTRPAIGNHEYGTSCGRNDPTGYFDYFGGSAGARDKGWYSYDVGGWHLVALNSECTYGRGATLVGGCGAGSPQETWLRKDLAAHPTSCTLAYWHEPRYSSGQHGDAQQMATIWNDLVAGHADVVLSGHNHDYERFDLLGSSIGETPPPTTPRTPAPPSFQQPVLDPLGIREFVVGTGGKNHYGFAVPALTGEPVRDDTAYGVLSMTLHPGGYDWSFVPEKGKSFTDRGSSTCH